MGRGAVWTTTAAALLAVALAVAPDGIAKSKHRIGVRPGPDAIGRALDRVAGGGVLRIHKGRYHEELTVEKRVKLVAAGKRRPVIDGDCDAQITLAVRADGVRLKHLKVVGADESAGPFPSEVDFRGVSGGIANDLVVRDTCDAEYGINAFDAGGVEIIGSRAVGFSDAGLYVGEIRSGPVEVTGNESYGNNRGLIVENSESPVANYIQVRDNEFHDNNIPGFTGPTGILINNSDGVVMQGNQVRSNAEFGLHLSPTSDRNVVTNNAIVGNPIDIRDQGTGNCGSGNSFETGDALPPC
jgi:parallel beta-helix repeat protein